MNTLFDRRQIGLSWSPFGPHRDWANLLLAGVTTFCLRLGARSSSVCHWPARGWAVAGIWLATTTLQPATDCVAAGSEDKPAGQDLTILRYNNPTLTVDLGVGLWAWPLPMDFDRDGDFDLVVSCPDKPFNGTYVFENPGTEVGEKRPVFKAPRRISEGKRNVQLSWVNGSERVMTPGAEYPDFRKSGLEHPRSLDVNVDFHQPLGNRSDKIRASQWKYVDYEGDGDHDLLVGIGDWSDYGWDDAYDENGNWTHGPLHGFVYLWINRNSDASPDYADPVKLKTANGRAIDVFGWPSPNLQDFDGDGDLDLLCGEFLDGFTYFQNVGTRGRPSYQAGHRLRATNGKPLQMDLQMIVPIAVDWDGDHDLDLIVGDEDGRVALVEHIGLDTQNRPRFKTPFYFQQEANRIKCGALSTPCCVDWDCDGDVDLLSGNTAGYIVWFENLGQTDPSKTPKFAAGRRLSAGGRTLRIQAGANGSIQGPCEAKWGYTTLTAADWDHDGRVDLVVNSIWGKVQWYRNIGTPQKPELAPAQNVQVDWSVTDPAEIPKPAWTWWSPEPNQLVTQWRTTPVAVDWTEDDLIDLVMLDPEGYLSLYRRAPKTKSNVPAAPARLLPPQRIFCDEQGQPLRLNHRKAGGSGRRKIAIDDWDGDGRRDLIVNSTSADWFRQVGQEGHKVLFQRKGRLAERELSSHTTSPTTVDWNQNGVPDLLIGAEDGHFYYRSR